jgi:hypothetical protein
VAGREGRLTPAALAIACRLRFAEIPKHMNKRRVLLLVLLGACMPLTAQAYIDPGTGMLVWQGAIAAVGAILVFVRNPVAAVKRLIERIRRK